VATASVQNVESGKVENIVRVKKEPEGVAITPTVGTSTSSARPAARSWSSTPRRTRRSPRFPSAAGRGPSRPCRTGHAFIPSEAAGTVTEVDAASHRILCVLKLPEGSRPMGSATAADGKRLYVSTGRAGTVCVLDPLSGAVLNTIPVGKRPRGLDLSPDGRLLFVANGPPDAVSVTWRRPRRPAA
jgi:YVTN family beta-propeller protein